MKYLTTYLDDEINFKFGNNGSIIELKAVDDHAVMSFSNEEKLLIRIKNEESYIKTVPVTAERKIIQLPTKLLKDLTVGQYDVELWQGEGDDQVIYPDEGFLRLKIHGNASQIDGSLVSSITLADFEKKFNELAQKIEDKLEKLPDIDGKNISIDVKVVDGNLCINGKDTGINLTAKDGRDGRDGHTPEITVSDAGTLVVDGIDTNKSLIGPRGENGLPGKDGVAGQDGKSAYQVAVDNGFDGTEVEWLRSLHGNDGLDGKSGRDGLPGQSGKSAYEIAITNGFTGTEPEWLESLKGRDGHDGKDANVDLSKYPTKDEIANRYVQRTDLPNIVLDTDQRTLIINNKEIKIPNSIDLSNYAQKSEIPNIVFDVENNMLTINDNKVKIPKDVDLSVYYTKADIDEKIATVQSGGKIDLSNYVTQQELSEYVKKTDIPVVPDLAPYETKENAERTYATKEEVANIQLTPGKNGLSAYELAKKDGFHGTEIEWLASLKGKDANPTLVLNTIHDKGFWGDTTIRNSFDPQINIVTTKPLKVGNLASITIDNVVLPGKAAIGVGTLEGSTYTFAYCKVADLSVGDTTIQLDWPIQNDNYYLFVSGKPFQTRGNGDVDAGSRFKYMLADTRNYDTGNRIKVDGESLGSFKYNFVLNYTGKTRIDLDQILKNTMPYANKKITFLGDSVTSGGTTSNGKQAFSYVDYLKDYLGAEITNKGLSGSVITEGNIENQTQSFVSRSNQIQDQDFVTIFGGINDFWFNSPLGSMRDSSDNVETFYGALKFLVENLSKKNPNAHFLFVTPLKECKEGVPHTYEDNNKFVLYKNRAGFTEEDYVNAIKEVAAYYSVPVLDLFNSSNMNPYIESQRQYFADDLHPNQLGAQRLALLISQVINNGVSSGFLREANGKSAYYLWLDAGNNGTEQDFLNSLKGLQGESGPAGKNGADGLSAYEVAQKNGFSGTEQEWLASLKGERGEAGLRGPKGDPGQIPDVSNINKGISDNKSDISKINLKMSTMFVNLLDFGAQPENVNFDNAPAFNKAIQALPSVGGTIFIPNGNYFLKSTVNIDRSYVHVMGLNHGLRSGIDPVDGSTQAGGGGAKVTVQNPITAFKLENTHNNNRLSGITFSGFDLRGDTNAGVGIDGISNTDRVVIDNMTINNVGIGVRLHAADAPRITNSWIAETQSSILLTGASQQAEIKNNSLGAQPKGTTIYMENPDRFNISGNNIYPDGASAIRILNPVHGSIVGNTISAYYNGMIEFLPNSEGTFGNGNVISSNVIALESWHDNPDGKDNKWGIVHIEAFSNVISDNNILVNGSPANTTGILVMKGDYNRIANNVMNISDTNSKVVINGAANNNWVIYSTEGFAFQDGGNQSNKNIGI